MAVNDETWRAERMVLDAALALEAVIGSVGEPVAFGVLIGATRDLARLAARDAEALWVERTWRDVRQGDVIRPVGMLEHAARVEDIARHTRTTRRVTMQPWVASDYADPENQPPPFTRDVSNPDASVEIFTTRGELSAVMALGGWSQRQGVIWDA